MKIAVLLRGQPRFTKEGASLFDYFVKQNYPNIDFDFFIHSWDSISETMTLDNNKLPINFIKKIDKNNLLKKIKKSWGENNIKNIRIDNSNILVNLVKDIYEKLSENDNREIYNFLIKKGILNKQIIHFYMLFPTNFFDRYNDLKIEEKHYTDKFILIEHIKLLNNFGQTVSACLSYDLLNDYIKSNPDYNPDLVIIMRHDTILYTKMLFDIINMVKGFDNRNIEIILSENVLMIGDKSHMADFCFIGSYKNFNSFFGGNYYKKHYDLMTKNIIDRIEIANSSTSISHFLWHKIGKKTLQYSDCKWWKESVIRPNLCESNLKLTSNDEKNFEILLHKSNEYIHPANYVTSLEECTEEQIFNLWNALNEK